MRDPKATPPPANSARNSEFRDVIGNKNDDHDGTSAMSQLYAIEKHVHGPSLTYPTLAAGVTVTSHVDAWTLSAAFTEVVPTATITDDFDIHYVSIEGLDDNDVYELWLYAVEVFVGRVRFTKNAVQDGIMNVPFMTDLIAGGSQIQAKLATETPASAGNAVISIFYHTY